MPFTSRFLPILLVPLLTIPCLASATPAYKVTGIVNEYNASPEGIYQYVLLTPDGASISLVPEPGQYIVLLLGLALLGFSINRQGLVRASIKP